MPSPQLFTFNISLNVDAMTCCYLVPLRIKRKTWISNFSIWKGRNLFSPIILLSAEEWKTEMILRMPRDQKQRHLKITAILHHYHLKSTKNEEFGEPYSTQEGTVRIGH
jgi:hypothetical protein